MEEIQFGNQENQINFIPESPKTEVASQPAPKFVVEEISRPLPGGKILPWACGVGLALIGGAIFYKVNLNQNNVLDNREVYRQQGETNVALDDQANTATANQNLATVVGDVVLEDTTANANNTGATVLTVKSRPTASPSVVGKSTTAQPSSRAQTNAQNNIAVNNTSNTNNSSKGGLVGQVSAQETVQVATVANSQVSGHVTVNGNIPSNSSILVLYRLPGSSQFQAGPRISASNGSAWSLTLPTGVNYEVKLAWQINENNYMTSETVTVKAPSKVNTTFNINVSSNNSGSTKPWNVGVDTCGSLSDNHWSSRLVLPKFTDNIVSYHVQIGTSEGNNDVLDHVFDQTEKVVFDRSLENDKNYYVRYQVKIGNSNSSWGDWSNTNKINCRKG